MINVSEPLLGKKELEYVNECISSGWVSSKGKFILQFEEKWARYCGRKYGVAVSNGTVALQAAVKALDLPYGSEVIIPDFTIISCALAVIYNGLIPVSVDAAPETWTIDPDKIEESITDKTRAIMPVHIYGHPCDMDKIINIAEKYGLKIIEDAAEAHGAEYNGKKCGSFGEMSTFSFYANKIVTSGEGGMILTDQEEYYERLKSIRNLSFGVEERFVHEDLGHNFRITNMQAAIGVAQVEKIEEHIEIKRRIAAAYKERLSGHKGLIMPVEKEWAKNVYWVFPVVINEVKNITAKTISDELRKKEIDTRPFFKGMHEQPVLSNVETFKNKKYPVCSAISEYGLYLPSGLTLSNDDVDYICHVMKEII